jgi:hypothetical protein
MYFLIKGIVFGDPQSPLKGLGVENGEIDSSPGRDRVGFYQLLGGTGYVN